MHNHWDLIVIGGGSGAMGVSRRAAQYGKRVAVIEESGRLGGTCVNVGCVPKKLMWHASAIREALIDSPEYGFGSENGDSFGPIPKFQWNYFCEKRDRYIRGLNDIYERNVAKDKVEYISGHAQLAGDGKVKVMLRNLDGTFEEDGQDMSAEQICIATGSSPLIPTVEDIPGASLGISSDGWFQLRKPPKTAIVVGAGYIAVELAGVMNGLGIKTHLVIRNETFLRNFDPIISSTLQNHMEETGVEIHKNTGVKQVVKESDDILRVELQNGSNLQTNILLWAVGRSPNTAFLGLDKAGVKTDKKGNIIVNEYQETNVRGITAIGDVTGKALLTPVAIAAGRRLSNRLYGPEHLRGKDRLDYSNIPTVIFSHPASGAVGLTEAEARKKYGNELVKVYRNDFGDLYYGMLTHKQPHAFKLVCAGHDEKVVGVHIVGSGSDEILQGFAVAIKMGATKKHLDDTVAIHPTAAEELVTMK